MASIAPVRKMIVPSLFAALILWIAIPIDAQLLPPHPPLRILIVSDEVNPHGLAPDDLSQPGELSAALLGVTDLATRGTDPIHEIGTDSLEDATVLLQLPSTDPNAYDVLIYFAHRIPNGADAQARQDAFVAAVETFLANGGGVVSFHHGIYRTAGKEGLQSLLGGEATGGVPWNTVDGQNVIAVAPDHFVAGYGVDYPLQIPYGDASLGIAAGTYPAFNNTPDERYPSFSLLPSAIGVEVLFASNYDGGTHLLGYVEQRPEWSGVVVVYQPGEYQPHALTPGNNFQILLNALVYAGTYADGAMIFGDRFETGDAGLWQQVP